MTYDVVIGAGLGGKIAAYEFAFTLDKTPRNLNWSSSGK